MKDNKDREEVMAAVKEDGIALQYADKSFRKDREISETWKDRNN